MTTENDAPTMPDTDRAAVLELVARAGAAQNLPEDLMALHADGAVVVNFSGRRVLGRTAFAEAMRNALTGALARVETTVEVLDVRPVTRDVVMVSAAKTVHDDRVDGEELPARQGALTYVVRRDEQGWRIALAQTTPILWTQPVPPRLQ